MKGKFFKMMPSPELRLYMVLLSKSGKEGNAVVTLENSEMMEFAGLNRNYLPRARKRLMLSKLIKAKRAGMKSYRYEILGAEGRSLSDKTTDNLDSYSDLDFAFQA